MEQVHQDVENFLQHECSCDKMQTLNNNLTDKNNLIMYVNIRSIQANLKNLESIIESLYIKPCVIICTETRKLENYKQYQLPSYKIFYNNSRINQNDGVAVYINSEIIEGTGTIVIDNVSFRGSRIRLDNKDKLIISAVYRCHDIPKTEFIWSVKNTL